MTRPRRPRPQRERARSPLTVRLRPEWLHDSTTSNLERLARGIGIALVRGDNEAEGPWRHRVIRAIMRREAELARGA